jgi:hypothetical protein
MANPFLDKTSFILLMLININKITFIKLIYT